jgi:class 3 adenylate cyclase
MVKVNIIFLKNHCTTSFKKNYHFKVASGLPERCTDKKHVSEIATMALDLLHASSYFKVPYSSHEKLEIRIGIHTGPVGAGIVGTKMPRYCLFGNKLNYF